MNIPSSFDAFFVEKKGDKYFSQIKQLPFHVLPENDVTVQVTYSSLNYKDALSASGMNQVTRNYPHIPGIDAAGTVVNDSSGTYNLGDKVLVTGFDLGTNTFGGFGEFIRVPTDWIVPLPEKLSLKKAMVFGTAGFTAIYGIERLKRELIFPDAGKVLVTGATGGVGSLAVFGLSQLGYSVVAATRKLDSSLFLNELGASEIVHSDSLLDVSSSPLLSRKWIGIIETVGGAILDSVLRQVDEKGAVACCGNILGKELSTNVYPFILRGISLLGIDSAICSQPLRNQIWDLISSFNLELLPESFSKTVQLSNLETEIDLMLKGKQTGRIVVAH